VSAAYVAALFFWTGR